MTFQSIKDRLKRFKTLRRLQPHPRLWGREKGDLPKLIVAGAQKSGTTFLHQCLCQSDHLFPSPLQKEIHYFDNKFYKNVKWYRRFFDKRNSKEINFETSPYYMFHPAVPKRMKETIPDAKVVMVLRDPVKRAHSHYWHEVRLGREDRSFREAVKQEIEFLKEENHRDQKIFEDPFFFSPEHMHFTYVERSLYSEQIKRWMSEYRRNRILVLFSENLFQKTDETTRRVASFVGIEKWIPKKKVNKNKGNYERDINKETNNIINNFVEEYNEELKRMVDHGSVSWL